MARLPIAEAESAELRIDAPMHTAMIRRIALSSDDQMLATASHDKTVRLWSINANNVVCPMRTLRPPIGPGDEGKVNAVALAPDGSWCAAGGWFSTTRTEYVFIFDTASGAIRNRLGPLPKAVHEIEVSRDGSTLAAGLGSTGGLYIWQQTGSAWKPAFTDTEYADSVEGLAFTPDGRLLSTSCDGKLRTYAADGNHRSVVPAPAAGQPLGIAVSPDGSHIAIGYQHILRVDVLDAMTLKLISTADSRGLSGGNLAVVAWLSDGTLAAAGTHGDNSSPIVLWPDGGRAPRRTLPGPRNTIMDLKPWRDGLAYGAFDPAFGLVAGDGATSFVAPPPMADLRGRRSSNFLVSKDGHRVRFSLHPSGDTPHLIDVVGLTLAPSPISPPDLVAADTASLPIKDWNDTSRPVIGRWRIGLRDNEISHSLAILPRETGFILGTEWRLRRFDTRGRHVWRSPAPGPAWYVNTARDGRLIVAAYGDGTIRWHRAADGQELLALFVHVGWPGYPRRQTPTPLAWILWTPEGYYACAEGADDLIGWHVNRGAQAAADFYPASTFAATFKQPQLVAAALDAA
jgi:WD40 repeat protein